MAARSNKTYHEEGSKMNLNEHVYPPTDPCSEMMVNLIVAVKAYSVSDAFGGHASRVTQSDSLHNRISPSWVSSKQKLLLPLPLARLCISFHP